MFSKLDALGLYALLLTTFNGLTLSMLAFAVLDELPALPFYLTTWRLGGGAGSEDSPDSDSE